MATAKEITRTEQQQAEKLRTELENAIEKAVEAQQVAERAKMRVERNNRQLAQKYRLKGADEITSYGEIIREKDKPKADPPK